MLRPSLFLRDFLQWLNKDGMTAWVGLLCTIAAGVIIGGPAIAQAQATTFTGPSGGSWENAANWSAGVPGPSSTAIVPAGATVVVNAGAHNIGSLDNRGTITGPDGTAASRDGGSVLITTTGNISNTGTITGGKGFTDGGGAAAGRGGDGGSVGLTEGVGGTVTNSGTIHGGDGGSTNLPGSTQAGRGGSATLTSTICSTCGGGGVTNTGTIRGGDGGTSPVRPPVASVDGRGGDVRVFGGTLDSRSGTLEGGSSETPGKKGSVQNSATNTLSYNSSGSSVLGGSVNLATTETLGLIDLSSLHAAAITATDFDVTISTTTGGIVDLRGNPAGIDVITAASAIDIFADTILLDSGVSLADITSPNAVAHPSVPEPGILVLVGPGLAALGGIAWSRRWNWASRRGRLKEPPVAESR